MNFRLCTGLAALVCLSMASCYPYNEGTNKKDPTKPVEKKLTPEELAKQKEADARKKAEDELKKKKAEETASTTTPDTAGGATGGTTTTPAGGGEAKPEEPKRDFAFANKVPGKEGFVFSPYNNKVVDVRDIPSGTLVQDPTYPAAEKKYFRVP